MIPDWAPNLHPMVVHFPVALLVAAVLLDVLSLFWRKRFASTALTLYVLGGLGTVAGYLSGRAAASSVEISGQANVVLTTHADWGTAALWSFGIYALLRLFLAWQVHLQRRLVVHVSLILVAVGGLVVLYRTADSGARMVYEYGVGVQAIETMAAELQSSRRTLARLQGQQELPVVEEDGSWHWTPGPFAAEVFVQAFEQQAGGVEAVVTGDTAIAFTARRSPALFVLNRDLQSVQVDLEMDLDHFSGSVQVVYNLTDPTSYYFTEFANGRVRQGRVTGGERSLMDDQPFVPEGWTRYRVVSDRTHFRAYANGTMIVHGHGVAPEAGPVGLRLSGDGTVVVGRVGAVALR